MLTLFSFFSCTIVRLNNMSSFEDEGKETNFVSSTFCMKAKEKTGCCLGVMVWVGLPLETPAVSFGWLQKYLPLPGEGGYWVPKCWCHEIMSHTCVMVDTFSSASNLKGSVVSVSASARQISPSFTSPSSSQIPEEGSVSDSWHVWNSLHSAALPGLL